MVYTLYLPCRQPLVSVHFSMLWKSTGREWKHCCSYISHYSEHYILKMLCCSVIKIWLLDSISFVCFDVRISNPEDKQEEKWIIGFLYKKKGWFLADSTSHMSRVLLDILTTKSFENKADYPLKCFYSSAYTLLSLKRSN